MPGGKNTGGRHVLGLNAQHISSTQAYKLQFLGTPFSCRATAPPNRDLGVSVTHCVTLTRWEHGVG